MKYGLLGFLVLLLTGCSWVYEIGAKETNSTYDISEAGMEVTNLEFTNQEGETTQVSDFEGDYWLANMIFTNCSTVCPLLSPNLQNLQAATIEEGLPIKVISFTVDPNQDNPELLKQYGRNLGVDFDTWTFATGYEEEEIVQFSLDSFKSRLEKAEDGSDILHTTAFFLVDPEGNIIRKYDGLETDQEEYIEDLAQAIETN
ncbi:SCO family protein [Alkalicoccobacillus gibsonii]|uniref:SCO family protein n=1 Tax=Alkalicoccobacillus gibsonii TaxID=79881 RepID=A0ABU9VJX6_9BACI